MLTWFKRYGIVIANCLTLLVASSLGVCFLKHKIVLLIILEAYILVTTASMIVCYNVFPNSEYNITSAKNIRNAILYTLCIWTPLFVFGGIFK